MCYQICLDLWCSHGMIYCVLLWFLLLLLYMWCYLPLAFLSTTNYFLISIKELENLFCSCSMGVSCSAGWESWLGWLSTSIGLECFIFGFEWSEVKWVIFSCIAKKCSFVREKESSGQLAKKLEHPSTRRKLFVFDIMG